MPHKGTIELITGTMRSNKTEETIRRVVMRRTYAHQNVLLLKPNSDTKSGEGVVQSRNPNGHGKMEAVTFDSQDPWSILPIIAEEERRIGARLHCIAIDEGQFVKDLFAFVGRLLENGYDLIVSGLDLDFRALPFGDMINLLWYVKQYGGSHMECVAYCECGKRALFPERLIDGKPAPYDSPVVMPGEMYKPCCLEHFVLPGCPH